MLATLIYEALFEQANQATETGDRLKERGSLMAAQAEYQTAVILFRLAGAADMVRVKLKEAGE